MTRVPHFSPLSRLSVGVSVVSLGLALSAHAVTVKLGTDAGGLVFDPDTVTIKAGESVTWVNNAGAFLV